MSRHKGNGNGNGNGSSNGKKKRKRKTKPLGRQHQRRAVVRAETGGREERRRRSLYW